MPKEKIAASVAQNSGGLLDALPGGFGGAQIGALSAVSPISINDLSLQQMKDVGNAAGSVNTGGGLDLGSKLQVAGNVLGMFKKAGQALDKIPQIFGLGTDFVSESTATRAGFGKQQKMTKLLQMIPGVQFMMMGANQKMEQAKQTAYLDTVGSGFTASAQDIQAAQDISGQRLALGREKAQTFLNTANAQNAAIARIGMETELAKQNNSAELYQRQNFNKYSGFAPKLLVKNGIKFPGIDAAHRIVKNLTKKKQDNIRLGNTLMNLRAIHDVDPGTSAATTVAEAVVDAKNGFTGQEAENLLKNIIYDINASYDTNLLNGAESIEKNKDIISKIIIASGRNDLLTLLEAPLTEQSIHILHEFLEEVSNKNQISKFQLGGKITSNYIPEGALHRNKHHITDSMPELEGQITEKGIPVVSLTESGAQQHAEIEGNELTLSLPTTHKIEEYYKEYQENPSDDILIECGRYFVNEIIKNTEDPGKLIKEL